MKTIFVALFLCICFFANCIAQSEKDTRIDNEIIKMLFPQGKRKAVILSYDDGSKSDRRLVKLLNQYNLIGTFHLNSNKLNTACCLRKDEIKRLFVGHEVSIHTANHDHLTKLDDASVITEIVEDRKELEKLTGKLVRGMAYPFGDFNDKVAFIAKNQGIDYARTVYDTYQFSLPLDFLKWSPTIHQFGKASYEPQKPKLDSVELANFYQLVGRFLKSDTISLLYVWGHSWELDSDESKWVETARFFEMISNKSEILYTNTIELTDYIKAYQNLKFSADKNKISNLSATDIWVLVNGKAFIVPAGKTITLSK